MFGSRKFAFYFGLALAGALPAAGALADGPFVLSLPDATFNVGANLSLGYQFTVGGSPITVDSLGFFDDDLAGNAEAHPITLYSIGGSPIATATVPAGTGGTLIGDFRYANLASPVVLSANTSYVILAYYPLNLDPYARALSSAPTTATYATYDSSRSVAGNGFASGNLLGVPNSYFGPNFNTVPEPAALSLLAIGGGLLLRRRKRAAA